MANCGKRVGGRKRYLKGVSTVKLCLEGTRSEARAQMGEEADSLYLIREGNVSVEASFAEPSIAQRAVDFPVNVAAESSDWCACGFHFPQAICKQHFTAPWVPMGNLRSVFIGRWCSLLQTLHMIEPITLCVMTGR